MGIVELRPPVGARRARAVQPGHRARRGRGGLSQRGASAAASGRAPRRQATRSTSRPPAPPTRRRETRSRSPASTPRRWPGSSAGRCRSPTVSWTATGDPPRRSSTAPSAGPASHGGRVQQERIPLRLPDEPHQRRPALAGEHLGAQLQRQPCLPAGADLRRHAPVRGLPVHDHRDNRLRRRGARDRSVQRNDPLAGRRPPRRSGARRWTEAA